MWHRVGPPERSTAPWKLTGMDGRTCFGRVQYQDGNWQGQVIVNSLPADWRRNNRGISYPSGWHQKRADAFDAVETFLAASVRSLFKAEELTFLTWDDLEPETKADKADNADKPKSLLREPTSPPMIIMDEIEIQRRRTEELRQITDRIAKDELKHDFAKWAKVQPPFKLSRIEEDMLKKYWG
jgi:hypothetical protein